MKKSLDIKATHPRLGEVTIERLLPLQLPVIIKETSATYDVGDYWPANNPITDELYYRKALVTDADGNKHKILLRNLQYDGKLIVQYVLDHEAIQKYKAEKPNQEALYLHSHYGEVKLVDKYTDDSWLCRTSSGVEVTSDVRYDVDFEQFSPKQRSPLHGLKEFISHPCELIPIENLKKLEPKDEYLYAAYADVGAVAETQATYNVKRKKNNSPKTSVPDEINTTESVPPGPSATVSQPSARKDDVTMKSIDEFLTVLENLPRAVRTKKISDTKGKWHTIKYLEAPRVIARGESSKRLYITPAWWLWRVSGEFIQTPYKADGCDDNGKVVERYRWKNPTFKDSIPTLPPTWFSYDPDSEDNYRYSGFLMELPQKLTEYTPRKSPISKLLETNAWYHKLPPSTARDFSISGLEIKWAKPPLKIGSPLAIITLTYKGKAYQVPVHLAPKGELSVKVKSPQLGAFLCRYTISKLAKALNKA